MKSKHRLLSHLVMLLACSFFAGGAVLAQEDGEEDNTKTKQAQAVSKAVYDRIQKAQEEIDADNPNEALKILEGLKTRKGLTEYELQNVLNYIGFVHYNLENIDQVMAAQSDLVEIAHTLRQVVCVKG